MSRSGDMPPVRQLGPMASRAPTRCSQAWLSTCGATGVVQHTSTQTRCTVLLLWPCTASLAHGAQGRLPTADPSTGCSSERTCTPSILWHGARRVHAHALRHCVCWLQYDRWLSGFRVSSLLAAPLSGADRSTPGWLLTGLLLGAVPWCQRDHVVISV